MMKRTYIHNARIVNEGQTFEGAIVIENEVIAEVLKAGETPASPCEETIELDKIKFKGYAFQIEMKFTAYKCGFKIAEVPVIFVNRELGTSKMNSSIFGEAFFGVMQLKWSSWFRKYPQKK